jgi:hypothetical protein
MPGVLVLLVLLVVMLKPSPTMAQFVLEEHDRSEGSSTDAPEGAGTGCVFKELPFHVASSSLVVPDAFMTIPVSRHDVRVKHRAAVNSSVTDPPPAVFRPHFEPFHVQAS